MTRIPNLFIIGAPKCGTTSLYKYLDSHPNIYFSRIKEPNYLCTDFPGIMRVNSDSEYYDLFKDALEHHEVVGESSVYYLYSSVAVEKIFKINPLAKIIVMIRNPVDMLASYHAQLHFRLYEDLKDFRQAWDLQDQRLQGECIPRMCKIPEGLQYREVAKYGKQIKRVLNIFPKEQVKIIALEDFAKSPLEQYQAVLKFLGVDVSHIPNFSAHNKNTVNRSRILAALYYTNHPVIESIYKKIKDLIGMSDIGIKNRLRRLNRMEKHRPPLDEEFKKQLISEFSDDIALLGDLTNNDFSHWL